MTKEQVSVRKKKNSLRTHKYAFTLNDEENKALNRYIEKYSVHNCSRFFREAVMMSIIKKLAEDQPTLFD